MFHILQLFHPMPSPEGQPFDQELRETDIPLPDDTLLAYRLVTAAANTLSSNLNLQPGMVEEIMEVPLVHPSPFDVNPVQTPPTKMSIQDTVQAAVRGLNQAYNRFRMLRYDELPIPLPLLERYIRRESDRGNVPIPLLVFTNPDDSSQQITHPAVITSIKNDSAEAYYPLLDQEGTINLRALRDYAARVGIGRIWTPVQIIGHPFGWQRT